MKRISMFSGMFILAILFAFMGSPLLNAQTVTPDISGYFSVNRLVENGGVRILSATPEFQSFTDALGKRLDSEYDKAAAQIGGPAGEPAKYIREKIARAIGNPDVKSLDVLELALNEVDAVTVDYWNSKTANPGEGDAVIGAVIKFEPTDLFDLLKFANEGTDYKIVKDEAEQKLYSAVDPNNFRTIYFGYKKYADLKRSIVIFATTKEFAQWKLDDKTSLEKLLKNDAAIFELSLGKTYFDWLRTQDMYKDMKKSSDFGASIATKIVDAIEQIKVSVRETDGTTKLQLGIKGVTIEETKNLKDMFEGFIAIAKLSTSNSDLPEEARNALALLEDMKIVLADDTIVFSYDFNDGRLLSLVQEGLKIAIDRINE